MQYGMHQFFFYICLRRSATATVRVSSLSAYRSSQHMIKHNGARIIAQPPHSCTQCPGLSCYGTVRLSHLEHGRDDVLLLYGLDLVPGRPDVAQEHVLQHKFQKDELNYIMRYTDSYSRVRNRVCSNNF